MPSAFPRIARARSQSGRALAKVALIVKQQGEGVPTVMVGNVAYVRDKATNKVLADRASKPKRRHRRTRGL